jgi:hypothetical protein
MAGVAMAFLVLGQPPGWPAFVIVGALIVVFLLASLAMWRGSGWLGLIAFTLLVAVAFYGKEGLVGIGVAVFLVALSLMSAKKQEIIEEEEELLEDLDDEE